MVAAIPEFGFGSAVAAFRPGESRDVPFASLPYAFQNVVPVDAALVKSAIGDSA